MAEAMTVELREEERRVRDRHKAAAALFLARCLGGPAEPAHGPTAWPDRDAETGTAPLYGKQAFKDLFNMGGTGRERELEVLLVDEAGHILAESHEIPSLGQALDLLSRIPLPLSPNADKWLKEVMGENAVAGAATPACTVGPGPKTIGGQASGIGDVRKAARPIP